MSKQNGAELGVSYTLKSLNDVNISSYVANDLLVVDGTGSNITQVDASSFIPPVIGSGVANDIPIFTGSVPILADSGVQIVNTVFPPSFNVKLIDFDAANPLNTVIGYSDSGVTGSNVLIMAQAPLMNTDGGNIVIYQGSTGANQQLIIANQSVNGTAFMNADNILIESNSVSGIATLKTPNTSVTVQESDISLYDDNSGNYLFVNGTNISLYENQQSTNIIMNNNGITMNTNSEIYMQTSTGNDKLYIQNGGSQLWGTQTVLLNQIQEGHYIVMNSNGIQIAANTIKPVEIDTDDLLKLKILSTYGATGDVLRADGGGVGSGCRWANITPDIISKTGAKSGVNYSTVSNTFVNVDAVNLTSGAVLLPTDKKCTITCSIPYDATNASICSFGVYDSFTTSVIYAQNINHPSPSNVDNVDFSFVINGDGNPHTFTLQYAVSAGTLSVADQTTYTAGSLSGFARMDIKIEYAN